MTIVGLVPHLPPAISSGAAGASPSGLFAFEAAEALGGPALESEEKAFFAKRKLVNVAVLRYEANGRGLGIGKSASVRRWWIWIFGRVRGVGEDWFVDRVEALPEVLRASRMARARGKSLNLT